MKQYTVDFSKTKTWWEFHQALKKGLGLPEYYGKNADALWDCMTSDIENPAIIYIKGVKDLPKELDREIQLTLEVFKDTEEWYAEPNKEVKFIFVD